MRKYETGRSPEGHHLFSVPLEADEDGMIGRECPNEECQPRYFKMSMTVPDKFYQEVDFLEIDVTCPYCGMIDNMQHYHTRSQIEWIESMITRDIAKSLQNVLKSSFKQTAPISKGMFSINFTYKEGQLPSVRHYVEEKLKRAVVCDNCVYKYAVYGISFNCPICGEGNLLQHLNRSAEIIEVLLEEHGRIGQERGPEVGHHMVGNALEDVVGLFETFLKHIYMYEIKRRFPSEEVETRIRKMGGKFQRLEGAKLLFLEDLGVTLLAKCDRKDIAFLQDQFLRRHVLTHNLGLIDEKYIERAQTYKKQGEELDIEPSDVLRALEIVKGIIVDAMQCLQRN